ncbi:sodium:solute symporter family protein [Vibrio fluvialis]|nr:sodium:solute symporter family protein [Vibrio fluvialis]
MLTLAWVTTFTAIILAGILAGFKVKSASEWSGGKKTLSALETGTILAAFQIGGITIIGVSQMTFNVGLSAWWYTLTAGIYFIAFFVISPFIRRKMPSESVPAFLEQRYSPTVSKIYSYVFLVLGIFYIPIQLFTLATVIAMVIPGIDLKIGAIIGLLLASVYTIFSGMQGVKRVSKYTCYMIYLAIVSSSVYAFYQQGGMSFITANIEPQMLTLTQLPTSQVIGWTLISLIAGNTMQASLQPLLAAKDARAAQYGSLYAAAIVAPLGFFVALLALTFKATGASVENTASVFSESVYSMMHPVVAGVIFATVTLVIVTTTSSMLLALGTILKNIYSTQINPSASESQVLKFSRIATVVFAMLTLIPTLLLDKASILPIFMTMIAMATAPMSFTIIGGWCLKKVTKTSAILSIGVGITTGVVWQILSLDQALQTIYAITIATNVTGFVSMMLKSKSTPKLATD